MAALKLILFAVLLTIVDCREFGRHISRGNVRHRQAAEDYNYNHPPASENYEPIPVAVVYEDEGSRKDKSVTSDFPETNKVQQINRGIPKSNHTVTLEDRNTSININPNKAEINEEYELKPTGRPTVNTKTSNQEHQIPVAIVYEPESSYYKETHPTGHRVVNKRRKIPRPAPEEKRVASEAEKEQIAFTAEEKRVAPTVNEKRVSPEEKQEQVAHTAEEKRVAPAAEKKRVAPTAEQERVAPAAEEKRVAPAAEKKRVAPTAEQERVAPVAEEKRVAPPVEKERVGPTAEKKRIDPAAEENQKAYEITTTRYHETIRRKSESNPPQQFPKRDNIDNSTLQRKEVVPIVQSENLVFSHSGDFQYSYEGGDGTKAFEKGQLKTYEDDNAGEAVSGGFSYTAKDGNEYSLTYTADENGYRPVGTHLPTPPPIPPAIARALAYLATKTTPEPVTDSIK